LQGGGAWARLPRLRLPALVTGGDSDIILRPENQKRFAKRIRGARRFVMPHAGYAWTTINPVRAAKVINRFLR
jgi:pimeloyl-ACP methyl ester carboxylesterase